MTTFRVIDTGVREGRAQIAFDQALIELHGQGRVPDTIRFLRFPPTALIGRHQAIGQELKLDYCQANGIGTVRRITGGGAIYLDEGQLGWELVFSRSNLALGGLEDYGRAICEALAAGLSERFGIAAQFRPRNDIEVGGRKIGGAGGFFDGDTLIYQGTVLVDMDPARMVACLNVPKAKLEKRDLDKAEQRVTTLKDLLGGETPEMASVMDAVLDGFSNGLGLALTRGEPSKAEEKLATEHYEEEIGTDDFVHEIDEPGGSGLNNGSHTGPGGTVSAYLRLEGPNQSRIREALITGDFFITPPRLIYDLEASLRGVPVRQAGEAVEQFFAQHQPQFLTIAPADFRAAIEAALEQA